jgi:hypothetical protein
VEKIKNTEGSAMSVGSVAVQLQYDLYVVGHLSKLAFHFKFKVVCLVVVVSSFRLACNLYTSPPFFLLASILRKTCTPLVCLVKNQNHCLAVLCFSGFSCLSGFLSFCYSLTTPVSSANSNSFQTNACHSGDLW